jgi:tetratricopeptide (TPR) repeat protein
MKAEHRHELKTNELVEWLTNLPQWARENRITLIIASVVIAVAAGLYIWKVYTKNIAAVQKQLQFTNLVSQVSMSKMQILGAQADGRDLSFILLQPAENLKNLAQNANTNEMAAFALIKRAEAIRAELHYRLGTGSNQDLIRQIEQAKNSYAQAIEKASSNPSLMAAAQFGLGLCEEELGDFEKAAQIYREVAENPNLQGTVANTAAKHRLETMADYKQKLTFKPAPKPRPVTPIGPLIHKLPIDTNLSPDINRPVETNLPHDINLPAGSGPRPQSPNNVSVVPDTNLGPQMPTSVPPLTDVNSPNK